MTIFESEDFIIEDLDAIVHAAGTESPRLYIHLVVYRNILPDRPVFHNLAQTIYPLMFSNCTEDGIAAK